MANVMANVCFLHPFPQLGEGMASCVLFMAFFPEPEATRNIVRVLNVTNDSNSLVT